MEGKEREGKEREGEGKKEKGKEGKGREGIPIVSFFNIFPRIPFPYSIFFFSSHRRGTEMSIPTSLCSFFLQGRFQDYSQGGARFLGTTKIQEIGTKTICAKCVFIKPPRAIIVPT